MQVAHSSARIAMGLSPEPQVHEAWGWRGRTLSQPVTAPDGPAWLRIACAPLGRIAATFWNGSIEAEKFMPTSIPRLRLRACHDWSDEQWEYRAELYDRVTADPIAESATLSTAVDLAPTWWAALRSVLAEIAVVTTRRVTVYQAFLDNRAARLLGRAVPVPAH